jgi:uncharacterized protein YabE (DUF348 family)
VAPETRPSRPYRRLGSRQRRVRILVILNSGALMIVVLLLVYTFTQKTVTLDIGGHVHRFRTHADTVQDVLAEANVLIDPEDLIDPAPETRLTGGETITVRKALVVAVEADGPARQVRTQSVHPLDVLAELSIPVGKYDVIQVDGQDFSPERLAALRWNTPVTFIRVIRSATLKVVDDNRTLLVHTTQADVGRALDSVGLTLYLADRVTPDLSTPVYDGLSVVIERSVPVTIIADRRQFTSRAAGPTVGDALAEIGIAPVDLDYTIPSEESALEPDMTIRVVRVTEAMIIAHVSIPFDTVRQPNPGLAAGAERIVQAGADGVREQQIRVRYENGQETSRTIQDERIIESPVPRLIAYGPPAEQESQGNE